MKMFLKAAGERSTIVTSTKVGLIVGSVLALINYGDHIFLHRDMRALDWVKLVVTYLVPFCVATYGAAKYATRHSRDRQGKGTVGASKSSRGARKKR